MARWAVAFAVHADGRQGGIFNAPMLGPASLSKVASDRRQHRQHNEHGDDANSSMKRKPSSIAQAGRSHQAGAEKAQSEMDVNDRPIRAQRSGVNQHQPWNCAEEKKHHSDREPAALPDAKTKTAPARAAAKPKPQPRQRHAARPPQHKKHSLAGTRTGKSRTRPGSRSVSTTPCPQNFRRKTWQI